MSYKHVEAAVQGAQGGEYDQGIIDSLRGIEESPFTSYQFLDDDGNPEGGTSFGRGFCINWQRGPLGRGDDRRRQNGAFVEDIIKAVIDRINFYQDSKFANEFNEAALSSLQVAIDFLQRRTAEREERGVEGTMEE